VLYLKWYLRTFCLGSVSLKYITSYFTLGFVRAGSLVVGTLRLAGMLVSGLSHFLLSWMG